MKIADKIRGFDKFHQYRVHFHVTAYINKDVKLKVVDDHFVYNDKYPIKTIWAKSITEQQREQVGHYE
jgi:hypothetical protein